MRTVFGRRSSIATSAPLERRFTVPAGPVREALVVSFAILVYFGVRNLTAGSADTAFANARHLISLEDALGIGWEEALQSVTLRSDLLTDLLTGRTRLVAVGLASNAVGTVNPVRAVVAAARRVGALVFVDAVHAVPHRPADVVALGADFLACSPYKFFGPHLGVLWGRRDLLEQLPAYKVRPAPDSSPGRWMTGTPSFEAIAGTLAAVDYLAGSGAGARGAASCSTPAPEARRRSTRAASAATSSTSSSPTRPTSTSCSTPRAA